MVWKDCGYVSLTKNHRQVLIVLKHQRYVVYLSQLREVVDEKRSYTLIYEPPTSTRAQTKEEISQT
jgi:hypothetical protein